LFYLQRLGELYGLLDEELYHLLRRHDGNVTETMRFIETGKSKSEFFFFKYHMYLDSHDGNITETMRFIETGKVSKKIK